MDDQLCLERIVQGGRAAYKAITILYERYARRFYSYLGHRYRFSHQEREDILQNTFLRLARLSGQAFAVPDLPQPWLFRILHHCAIDYLAQQPREHIGSDLEQLRDDDSVAAPREASLADPLLAETTWAGVDAALRAFQADHLEPGTALELTILEGWGIRELAVFLNKPEGATREYLSYWRKRWRDYLQRFCPDCFVQS